MNTSNKRPLRPSPSNQGKGQENSWSVVMRSDEELEQVQDHEHARPDGGGPPGPGVVEEGLEGVGPGRRRQLFGGGQGLADVLVKGVALFLEVVGQDEV